MGLPRCGTTVQKSGPGMRCQGPVMVTCLDYIANTASVSMPTHVQVEFGLTDKVGDDRLAGFTLGEVLFESCCPSLLMGKPLTYFRFWPSHSEGLDRPGYLTQIQFRTTMLCRSE